MENILIGGQRLSPCTCKHCIVFKQFDGLNFDGLAGKRQNFPSQNFALYGNSGSSYYACHYSKVSHNFYWLLLFCVTMQMNIMAT